MLLHTLTTIAYLIGLIFTGSTFFRSHRTRKCDCRWAKENERKVTAQELELLLSQGERKR